MTDKNITRCGWCPMGDSEMDLLYQDYHDTEWGKPVYDDRVLFEFLILEGAQAGLSWSTILKKRIGYKNLFAGFDPKKVARFTDTKLEKILLDSSIVRNRLKVYSARKNAIAFLAIQKEFGSFEKYIWSFVGGSPQINNPKKMNDVPARTETSDAIAKDLKKRGCSFVGSTIIYAYMQAMGMVNDHTQECTFRK